MKLDPDLRRYRIALRIVAGLNAMVAVALLQNSDWRGASVCLVVGLLNVMMALNIPAHQRTRDTIRALSAALKEGPPKWTKT